MNIQHLAKVLEGRNDIAERETILNKAQKENQVIYGARAINNQVPTYLKKKTKDYDILTNKPSKSAKEVAVELNRRLGREEYSVEKAIHKGTFKVKDSQGSTVVDYTQIEGTPKIKKSWGNKYSDVKVIKRNIQKRLKDKSKEFRKEKDLDALKRIELSEEAFNF